MSIIKIAASLASLERLKKVVVKNLGNNEGSPEQIKNRAAKVLKHYEHPQTLKALQSNTAQVS